MYVRPILFRVFMKLCSLAVPVLSGFASIWYDYKSLQITFEMTKSFPVALFLLGKRPLCNAKILFFTTNGKNKWQDLVFV